jgi:hypothetical protein
MFMLVGLKCNEVLPVIQTEEAANNSRKMVSHKSRKSEQDKSANHSTAGQEYLGIHNAK